jgi:EAL domain-containing protein (putative c-di-GMP-specific phosphodiesterase class I)
VRRSLRAPIPLANQEITLTGSIGISVWDGSQTADDELLKEAELAMYRAKQSGSDRIEVFESGMRRDREARVEVEDELRRALEKGQVKVLYQPIVYLPTKELAGFEALFRWDHPKLGVVDPISLLSEAEEPDLAVKVEAYVLMRAGKDAARWLTELPRAERPLFVTANISSRHFFRPEAIQEIRHVLGRNIVPAGTLRLAVTESLVMGNPEQAAQVLNVLHGSGVELTLDDFGTGYSSLAYLNRFPFDAIKIDRELVRGSGSASGSAIMKSIVALAHELSKAVVAEGVERADEATLLRSIGCEYAQGYHFGEPIPDRAVMQLLKVVRRSERKMQPRGFFRPKQKSAKSTTEKPHRAVSTTGSSPATKPRANLPAGAVVRQRQKGINGKSLINGAASIGASLPAVAKKAAGAALEAVTAGGPPKSRTSTQPPKPAEARASQNGAVVVAPPLPPAGLAAGGYNHPAPAEPVQPKHASKMPPDGPRPPSIVTPLAKALERASTSQPPAPRQVTKGQRPSGRRHNGSAADPRPIKPPPPPIPAVPIAAPVIPVAAPVTAPPTMPSTMPPSTQPDFSSLPPSIAASLARLAGGALPGSPAQKGDAGAPVPESKPVSKVRSGGV